MSKEISSFKVFQLKSLMPSKMIAKKLGINLKARIGFYSGDEFVGIRIRKKRFGLTINRADLHKKARKFADEIAEI